MKTHVAQLFRYGLLVLDMGSRQVGSWPLHAGGDLELGARVGVADPKGSGLNLCPHRCGCVKQLPGNV